MTSKPAPLKIGNTIFDFSRPYIMGILNVTPDSFSDGGYHYDFDTACEHAREMVSEGADIIDIGGESTRPGSDPVSLKEELSRVIPVIRELSKSIEVPISIDTCKPEVAERALEAGASLINDITGLQGHTRMAEVASANEIPVVVMHMKGTPKIMQKNPHYHDLISEIQSFFDKSLTIAETAGISRQQIILDPGIGFGKRYEHNFQLIKHLAELKRYGLPLLVGASRKRFLSENDRYSVDQRLEQSLTAGVLAVLNGANFVRVHDIAGTRKALWTAEKIISA
jgi:dihydropteroate synthase